MSIPRFYCHNKYQDFNIYNHKTLVRSFYFAKCPECGKHFQFLTLENRIIEGLEAEKNFKELQKDIKLYKPALIYLKGLRYGVPAKKNNAEKTEYQIIKVKSYGKEKTVSNTLENTIKADFNSTAGLESVSA